MILKIDKVANKVDKVDNKVDKVENKVDKIQEIHQVTNHPNEFH
jgi:hypothetical protein